jgi:initiation factor 1A
VNEYLHSHIVSPCFTRTNAAQGGKNRRRGKNENDNEKRELVFKEEGQEYAQVVKMLGNGRLEAQCFDGARRLAHIRGKLRKKVWINQGDIILLSLRDYQDEKGDVIMKYSGRSSIPRHLATGINMVSRRGPLIKSLRRAPRERKDQRDRHVRRPGR